MVVFTCGHCGESVQKPKVEKHYLTKCRNRNPNLSCMDCFKDFLGNDYEAHTKCITEEERYSGKGFQAKEKKGEKKQNAWVEMLQSVLDEQKGAPSNVLRIIETISKHNNTPRKKPKFINFVKNVCGHKTHPRDIDQAWDLISVKLAALSIGNNQNDRSKATANGNTDESKDDQNEKETDNANDSLENEKTENKSDDEESKTNGHTEEQNGDESNKKLSKKQRKEEKKRKKYEAALQSATEPVEEEEEDVAEVKKGKKKKNKSISESANGDVEENDVDSKGKNKKRKRQDTVCSVNGNIEVDGKAKAPAPVVSKEKTVKKKLKIEDELDQESDNLHNQNVAKIEELSMNSDKFDWHAVIMSVLEKKDNEMPFKRLQKKVLSEYMEMTGRDIDDRIADKFIKKLRSAPKVRVDKNRVYIEV